MAGITAGLMTGGQHERLVVVVDDDRPVRESLSFLLETHGFAVTTLGSGGELLTDQRRGDAGCLIVDQHMPGIDGLTLVTMLLGEGVVVPTILITARLDDTTVARAESLGVVAVLEKPFPTRRLVELVSACLDPPP